jgi:hypothetical protein
VAAFLAMLLGVVGVAQATHALPDASEHTTVDQRVDDADATDDAYDQLGLGPGEDYTLRDGATDPDSGAPVAQSGRESRRQSLTYFSQMTDFQLADEESPARVELLDPGPSSAWRPQEAFVGYMVEYSVQQVNFFAGNSPFPGSDATMDFSLITGDQADNNQLNETVWIRELLEGGDPINFNSGLSQAGDYANPVDLGASCALFVAQEGGAAGAAAEGAAYTGVQDHDDYNSATAEAYFYDPDQPADTPAFASFPMWTGLMDRAQQVSFTPAGLDVPFYLTNGNHDVLVQGNEDANVAFETVATGCTKAVGETAAPPNQSILQRNLTDLLEGNFAGAVTALVPPDPQRQFVNKLQVKQIYAENPDPSADPEQGHGFGLVDPAENAASNGAASYYSWEPIQGMQFISIDTNSEGGQTAEGVAPGSSNGNIDDPQFQWLQAELDKAQAANKLIVLFGHHPVRSMNTQIVDEQAPQCFAGDDGHGHDANPGCDLDPRVSAPLHLGDDPASPGRTFVDLIEDYPNVIAYVPGHTHEHRLTPFPREDGTTWWELNTSAVVDHPTQSRLIELFDNADGTLSIFTNVLDFGADSTAPAAGSAAAFDENDLASIGRTLAYNDPQNNFSGEGAVEDRNAELLLDDPRDGVPNPPGGDQPGGQNPASGTCKGQQATISGTDGKDTLTGTDGADVIVAGGGKDKVKGGGGNDLICGRGGNDKLKGNDGDDTLRGGGGRDRMSGGPGEDSCGGGARRDRGRGCEKGRDADRKKNRG